MSTDNVWIEVVGISGNVIEFWSAEPPDMAPTRMGLDHPATLIEILARVWSGDSALKNVIAGHDIAWIADHAGELIESVELVAAVQVDPAARREANDRIQAAVSELEGILDHAPRALYSVALRDSRFIAHMSVGDRFSTVTSAPPGQVSRVETRQRRTPSALRGLIELAQAPIDEARFHLFRRAPAAPGRWIQKSMPFLPSGVPDVERFRSPLVLSRRLQHLALEAGNTGGLVFFDKRASQFDSAKSPFKPTKIGRNGEVPSLADFKAKEAKMRAAKDPAGPFGFMLHFGDAVPLADGAWRIHLDEFCADYTERAWVGAEDAMVEWFTGHPSRRVDRAPVTIDDYLAEVETRIRCHLSS